MRLLLLGAALIAAAAAQDAARLLKEERLLADPAALKLLPSRTSTVFRAEPGQRQFNLHSYIAWHEERFWAIWSAGKVDEDSGNQIILYATSADGHRWSEAAVLADDPDGPDKPALWIARGIFVHQGKLTALPAYGEGPRDTPQGRESWHNLRLVRFEWDGGKWNDRGTFVDNCMNNYPPRALGGRLFMTCRDSFTNMHTAVASADGKQWTVTRLPGAPPADRMSEPSWYVDTRGIAHLIFRDARRSRFLFHSTSADQGRTWSAPVSTNYPDATSKNLTGRLSNGWYYLINNPNPKGRDPLAISFSRDGWSFANSKALRANPPPQRFPGRSKSPRSFQYPHAIEKDGSLWVIYSTNKEDIEISEFKIASLGLSKPSVKESSWLLDDSRLLASPMDLPLAPGRHAVAFRGEEGKSGFNLHSYIAHHDGRFWLMWSSSRVGEEDPDQLIRYATSRDGMTWSEAGTLADDPDGPEKPARWIARGLYVSQGKLNALGAYIESADYGKRGRDVVWKNLRLMRFEWTGKSWEARGVYAENCMNNFPPGRLGGFFAMPCRDSRMDVFMATSDAPGGSAWTSTPIAAEAPFNRMDEPTWYEAADGTAHMIVRDNSRSGFLIRSISTDKGRTWQPPTLTNYPDATSKNFTSKLASGTYYLINNPSHSGRDPLAISLSLDGWTFSHPQAIRKNAPARRFPGRAKPSGSFQYPHAVEHGGFLWITYSTNKEDIEVTKIAAKDLLAK